MVNNLFGYTEMTEVNFTDVTQTDWFYQEVKKALKAGYISGVSETKFDPNNILTREQAAVMVSKIMELEGNSAGTEIFTDSDKISKWAIEFVGSAAKAQLIKGYGDNTFRPQHPIKRAEAIVTLERTLGALNTADLVIDKSGTIVENKTIRNLHITKEVGNGEVTLKNINVTGELLIEGGGQNSVIVEDSIINKMTINKKDGKIRILLKGNTAVDVTSIKFGATLEDEGLTGEGFEEVLIDEDANESQTLTIKAKIGTLTVSAKVSVNVKTGIIESLVIEKTAEDASINLDKDSTVLLVTVDVKVSFTGIGKIARATINAEKVTFEQEPEEMDVKDGIEEPKIKAPVTGGGFGGGGGGGPVPSDVAVTGVSINKSSVTLGVGDTFELMANVEPSNANNKNVSWTSNRTTVAAINSKGVIFAKTTGSAIITVKTDSGGYTDTCEVSVTVPAATRGEVAEFIASNYNFEAVETYEFIDDVENSKYKDSIIELLEAGIIITYEDGTFRPDNYLTRAEFAKLLVIIEEAQNIDLSKFMSLPSNIIDVKEFDWYYKVMSIAINMGIFTPDSSGMVYPEELLSKSYLKQTTIDLINNVKLVTLESIAITTPASKTVYTVGSTLDISGLVVTGTYSDNSTKLEVISASNVSGFDSSKAIKSQTLTITVGGKTAKYAVEIKEAVALEPISIEKGHNGSNEVILTIDLNKTDIDIKNGYKATDFITNLSGGYIDFSTYPFSDFAENNGVYNVHLENPSWFNYNIKLLDLKVKDYIISSEVDVIFPDALATIPEIRYALPEFPTKINGDVNPDNEETIKDAYIKITYGDTEEESLDNYGNFNKNDNWLKVNYNKDSNEFSYEFNQDQLDTIEQMLDNVESFYYVYFKADYDEYEVDTFVDSIYVDKEAPILEYGEYFTEDGKNYLYLRFNEEIDVNNLFPAADDLSNIFGPTWGSAKVMLSNSDEFDYEVFIELSDDTIIANAITIYAESLVDICGNANSDDMIEFINFDTNIKILDTNIVYGVSDYEDYLVYVPEGVSVDQLLSSVEYTNSKDFVFVYDLYKDNVVPETELLINSMSLVFANENYVVFYYIRVIPKLTSINNTIIKNIDNRNTAITISPGHTAREVLDAIELLQLTTLK